MELEQARLLISQVSTSRTYRKSQRKLIESNDISSAVQINQLGYAFDEDFKKLSKTTEGKSATDSFNVMVGGMNTFTYAQDDEDITVEINPREKAEMLISRKMIETGRWPTFEEIGEIYKIVGIDNYWK